MPEDLKLEQECEQRLKDATPGPWRAQRLVPDGTVIRKPGYEIATPEYDVAANIQYGAPIRKDADAELIAHAPTDLRYYISLVKELRERIGDLAFHYRQAGMGTVADDIADLKALAPLPAPPAAEEEK